MIWSFRHTTNGTFEVQRVRLERQSESGEIDFCGAAWTANLVYGKEVAFGELASVNLLALVFVRVCQLQFVPLEETARRKVPILRMDSSREAFIKFKGLYETTTKRSSRTTWILRMFEFKDNNFDHLNRSRFERWFAVSTKREEGGVFCDLNSLWPDHIDLMIENGNAGSVTLFL